MLSFFITRAVVLYLPITLVTNMGAEGSGAHVKGVQNLFVASDRLGFGNPWLPSPIDADEPSLIKIKKLLAGQRAGLASRIRGALGL